MADDRYPWANAPDLGNLLHMLEASCTDPDCELHNIEVAIEEEVISPTDMAYWLSGVFAFAKLIEPHVDPIEFGTAIAKLTVMIPTPGRDQ